MEGTVSRRGSGTVWEKSYPRYTRGKPYQHGVPWLQLVQILLFSHRNKSSKPRVSGGRITKCRKAKNINKDSPSSYRPHVLASDCLQFWSSPYAVSCRNAIVSHIPAAISDNLMDVMLVSLEEKTRSNYGVGLLCFTQFCDTHDIA